MAEARAESGDPDPKRIAPPTALIKAVRSLIEMPPGPPRVWIAVRAALSISVPFAVLTLLGHPEIGLQFAAGSFVALFAAGNAAAERAKLLPIIGLALFVSFALGALLAPAPVWLAVGLVLVSVVSSALSLAFRVGPPGPVFFALSYGLAANVTGVVDGKRINDPVVFLAAVAGGMVFSYLLALAPLLLAKERARPVRRLRELLPGPWLGGGEAMLVLRIGIVAALGTLITVLWIDPHRAYWTVSAGIAVVGLSAVRRHSLGRGLHRTLGTIVGALLYVAIAPLTDSPLLLVALFALLQFTIEIVVVRNYALALVFITPLVLLMSAAATGGAHYLASAGERVLDTAIGSALAMLTALIHGPRQTPPR